MKIVEIFASQTWGGGEQYVFDLSRKLLKDNHSIFFAGKKSAVLEQKVASIEQKFYPISLNGYFCLASIRKLMKLIRNESIDIIHVHHFKAAFIAVWVKLWLRGKPKVILTRHLVRKGKKNILYRILYQYVDKIIFVSNLAKQRFLFTNPPIDSQKMEVIFNSIYTDGRKTILSNHINSNITVGFCGRLEKEKGIEVLLDAIPLCKSKNINFLIAGNGSWKEKIEQKSQCCDEIQMIGFQENVQDFMNQVDIGVTPTLVEEGFGLMNLEFMASGKPVITTDNGAQPEYITHNKNGFLIEPNSPEQLAHYIDYLAEHSEKRDEVGINAMQTFQEKLNYNIFYDKMLKVLLSLIR